MATMLCEVVTAERVVYRDQVNLVVVPGVEGMLGILPRHTPLMAALTFGEVLIRKEGAEDVLMAVGGGFIEVTGDHVTILADSAERAEEIDIARAEAARRRAEERMRQRYREDVDFARAEAALRRSLVRLRVAERVRQKQKGIPGAPQT